MHCVVKRTIDFILLFIIINLLIIPTDQALLSRNENDEKKQSNISFMLGSIRISIESLKNFHSCSTDSDIPLVDPITASIRILAEDLSACRYSSVDLVRWYLNRIHDVNQQGSYPLYAVIETNPDALDIAKKLDEERRINGTRSLLHGIPILIKDNIATDDRMETTAGSLALVGSRVPRDAFIVQKLRQVGAIILGKTSLSEWSNIKSENATRDGWSARGGASR
jgi:amidase